MENFGPGRSVDFDRKRTDSYLIKVHGSRFVTQQNCLFLKKMLP